MKFVSIPGILLLFVVLAVGTAIASEPAPQRLRWRSGPVQIALSTSLGRNTSNIKYNSDVAGAAQRSIETWQTVVGLDLRSAVSDKQSVSPSGNRGDGVSLITIAQTPENVLLFPNGADDAAATTRVFFDRRRLITEADIVLNPFRQFSTDGSFGTFDLESTITHEIGHLLGLEHSDVLGSAMHDKYGSNGIFPNFRGRSLSLSDIAETRKLYGVADGDETCCGSIAGRLGSADGKPRQWQIWAEEAATGRVIAETSSQADGDFKLDGLSAQMANLYAQESAGPTASVDGELGEVSIRADSTIQVKKRVVALSGRPQLQMIGLNGLLSDVAVSLAPGNTYSVFVGGTGLDPTRVSIGMTSPFFGVLPGSTRSVDYGPNVSVMGFELRVADDTPAGNYTIYISTANGARRYLIGSINVERKS